MLAFEFGLVYATMNEMSVDQQLLSGYKKRHVKRGVL